MKKLFLLALMLAAYVLASSSATAGEIIYYGDYAYTFDNGKAVIVDSNYNRCAPSWDDEILNMFNRPGKEDKSAMFPESSDANGVWRIVVPSTLDGHPVIAIGDSGLDTSMRGDIVLPEGLTSIGARAFTMCVNADTITIPASVTFIGKDAFDECSATLRVIEGSYAAQYAQENDIPYTYDLEYAVFQSGDWRYTLTGDTATIYDCDGYMYNQYDDDGTAGLELVIPDHLDGYPVAAIRNLSSPYDTLYNSGRVPTPNSIVIPAGVAEIDGNPFAGNLHGGVNASKLTEIIVSPDNPVFESVDGVLFNKQENKLVAFPGIRAGEYAIPGGITAIGDNAFELCTNLTSVTIPDSVTEIGDCAFYACDALTSLTIPEDVTYIGGWAFYKCTALADITIPEGVTRIGESAFESCSGLTSITIPASVTEIVGNPFVDCSNLLRIDVSSDNPIYKAVDGVLFDKRQNILVAFPSNRTGDYLIPKGVMAIGDDAFRGCKDLTIVTIPENATRIGDSAFASSGLTRVIIPESVTHIGDGAFDRCKGLASVMIPDRVTAISDSAFRWCESLTSVIIPEGVTHIGDDAFLGCKGLANVTIPENVTSIGDSAFASSGLTSVIIPGGVVYIGYRAFSSSDITSVTIPGSATIIGDTAFGWCESLTSAIIQEGVVGIGKNAFINCSRLTTVTIPESVTNIGSHAFYGCDRLARMTIPESVTSIGGNAFSKPYRGEPVVLSVIESSYAEQYAMKNEIPYTCTVVETDE